MDDAVLARLREQLQDRMRDEDWLGVLELADAAKQDPWWGPMWGAGAALAAAKTGSGRAMEYLDDAIAHGFCQPELLDDELEMAFGALPQWPMLVQQMNNNVPPPTLELIGWPELTPAHPLILDEVPPDRLGELLDRLPPAKPTAWATAQDLLRWVSTKWKHNGSAHVDREDAAHVLERVDGGERFACVEYSIVLTQALNARGIPARRLGLRTRNHHTGLGRGHVASEAWIDELAGWVVLDGQNGLYWTDATGTPLGLPQVMARHAAGQAPATHVDLAEPVTEAAAASWWSYFHSASPTGLSLVSAPHAPSLQGVAAIDSPRLTTTADGSYPDLGEVGLGVIGGIGQPPRLRFESPHPFAVGFQVTAAGDALTLLDREDGWPIPTAPTGDHVITVATRTRYGALKEHPIHYVVRERTA
jgi:hypothetical protein